MSVFVDANIMMYAAGREHPFKIPSVEWIQRAARGQEVVVTDAEVLQELLYRYWRAQAIEQGLHLCAQTMQWVSRILPVTRRDIEMAQRLLGVHRQIEPRDAVHAAVMLNHGITHICSYDRHFDAIPGLTRLEPA